MQTITFGTRIAIYARYSSSLQSERSIEDQVNRCRDYIAQNGGDLENVELFTDSAISGASLERAGMERLLASVEARRITSIVTEDVSRISRDLGDATTVFKALRFAKVPLISIADGINTNDKNAKLTFTLKSLVADLYLDDLRDKTRRGMLGRARAGQATGQVPYGYRTYPIIDERGRVNGSDILINEKAKDVVVRIFEMYAAGIAMQTIAHTFNREGIPSPRVGMRHQFAGWGPTTLHSILRNERYIGIWKFNTMEWVKVPGSNRRLPRKRPIDEVITMKRPHLAIVDLSLWEAVAQRLRLPRKQKNTQSRYLFSGLLFCATCGATLTIAGGSSARYYRCATNRTKGVCSNSVMVREKPMRFAILDAIRDELVRSKLLGAALANQNPGTRQRQQQIEQQEGELREIETQLERIVACVAAGDGSQRSEPRWPSSRRMLELREQGSTSSIAKRRRRVHT